MRKTRLEDAGDGLEWREDGLGTTERPAGPQGRDNGLGRAAVVRKEVEQITRRHRPSIGNKPKRLQQRSQTIQELREQKDRKRSKGAWGQLISVLMEGWLHRGQSPVGWVSVALSLCSRPSQDNSLEIPSSGCNSYLWSNTAQASVMQIPPPQPLSLQAQHPQGPATRDLQAPVHSE